MNRTIPFRPEFKDRMLNGKKTMTSRTRKYGDVGDSFEAFGASFTIMKVYRYKLDAVAYLHHREEGFESFEEFVKAWHVIHSRRGYDPAQEVWVHEFKKVEKS